MDKTSKLYQQLTYVAEKSPYYKRIFKENNIHIATMNDAMFNEIPFTTKDQLARFNEEFLCVPKSKVVDYITTSGTLSSPVSFYLTEKDTERLADNEATAFQLAGGTSEDVYQLMVTMDKQFMAGLAYYLGIKKMKAGAVRVGPTSPQNHLDTLIRFNTTVLIAIPSFIVKLIDVAKSQGIDLNQTAIKSIICIGEPIRQVDLSYNELGKRITDNWKVQLISTYASTEMGAAFTECVHGKGGHLNPEILYLEVVDEAGNPVKDGEMGEVVVTTLGVEGMPLLRYKTGDLCHVHYAKCACGSHTPRLGPIVGRKQQMIKFNGTTVFPPAIFEVLESQQISLYKVEVSKNEFGNDEIAILLPSEIKTDELVKQLKSIFRSKIRVTPHFKFLDKNLLMGMIHQEDKRKPEKIIFS